MINKKVIIMLSILFLINPASATTTYGDGWKKQCDDNGNCYYSNYLTYLRYDGVWIPAETVKHE